MTNDGRILVIFGRVSIAFGVLGLFSFFLILFLVILPLYPTKVMTYVVGDIGGGLLVAGTMLISAGLVVIRIGKKSDDFLQRKAGG